MLVLSRKTNESVRLRTSGGELLGVVSVESVKGDAVKLGFEFSDNVRIFRTELEPIEVIHAASESSRCDRSFTGVIGGAGA